MGSQNKVRGTTTNDEALINFESSLDANTERGAIVMKESPLWRVAVRVSRGMKEMEIQHLVVAWSFDNAHSLIRCHYEDEGPCKLVEVLGIAKQEEVVLIVSGE